MSDIGTFLMAVNKHNKSQVEALVTTIFLNVVVRCLIMLTNII